MSRYKVYLRGHKVKQEMRHPTVRMPPGAAVHLFDMHLSPPAYDSPAPNYGSASLKPLNPC
jgi:hypothetical protein